MLCLGGTHVSDAGCATVVAALDSGALPALEDVDLLCTPASDEAKADVSEALARLPALERLTLHHVLPASDAARVALYSARA